MQLLNDSDFLSIIQDFSKKYQLTLNYENNKHAVTLLINEQQYISENTDIMDCIKETVFQYLNSKSLVNKNWPSIEQLVEEMKK